MPLDAGKARQLVHFIAVGKPDFSFRNALNAQMADRLAHCVQPAAVHQIRFAIAH
jgi:hypothetical protein